MSHVPLTPRMRRLIYALWGVRMMRIVVPGYHMTNRELMDAADISAPNFHICISDLQSAGWVEAEMEVLPKGATGPRKTFYHLTEAGEKIVHDAGLHAKRPVSLRERFWKILGRR